MATTRGTSAARTVAATADADAERLVDEVEGAADRLRGTARAMLGVTGDEDPPPLREALRRCGVGWYPLGALSALVVVDEFQGVALTILGPEVTSALGIPRAGLAGLVALKGLAITLSTLPMAAFVQRYPRRALVAIVTAFLWGVMTLSTGFVTSVWGLIFVLVLDGASTGSVATIHAPLLIESYPPECRVRVLSFYRAANRLGDIAAPLMVAGLTAWLGFTWRGVFLAMGVTALLMATVSLRLRDPGFGRFDTARVRDLVRGRVQPGGAASDDQEPQVNLGFFEIVRRLLIIPTLRRLYASLSVMAIMIVPLATYFSFYLDERWGLGPGARGVFFGVMPLFSIVSLAIFGRRAEGLYRADPARLVRLAGSLLLANVVCIVLAILSPVFPLVVLFFGISNGLLIAVFPALNATILSIIPSRMRPHSSAIAGLFMGGGSLAGLLLLAGIDRRFGTGGAILSIAFPGFIAGFIFRSAANTVNADLNRAIDDLIEEEEVNTIVSRGEHLPMLSCRHINFAYGQMQVLFDVNFTVDDGEMVALLGTNGAGKSTLLRVVSGLGLPTGGTVRFRGRDITFLDAERRVRLGIIQVPGGRSVFGPLSVVENLRIFGSVHGRNRGAVDRGIDESFATFPRLAERRDQAASTLSGGEQQMLGLAQALILSPRLLLIDELSLGLAPKVVGELLELVRRINAAGTAVVLVEQSVNVALSLVDHAYFMEKGEIRFDGRSQDLLDRPDLLRSVFLAGVPPRAST